MPKHSAFTMVELIFVIVIIGILASIGIPKLSGVSEGAKKTAEIATISAVATAIEAAHGEWSINEGTFTWGNNQNSAANPLNSHGYPTTLAKNTDPFGALLNKATSKDEYITTGPITVVAGIPHTFSIITGPASNPTKGIKFDTKAPNSDIAGKPDRNDFWIYVSEINGSSNTASCTYLGKVFYNGDFLLIDTNGTGPASYPSALTCSN